VNDESSVASPLDPFLDDLDQRGFAILPQLLTVPCCQGLIQSYTQPGLFRSRIVMSRYNFGRGEYQYFDYPLPDTVQTLRQNLYERLAPLANAWMDRLRRPHRYPGTLKAYLRRCHRDGQKRPTPLLLKYGAGDYNCLHQDLYGDAYFPMQVTVLLSQPGPDYGGGEFIVVEQRPRKQSRASVVPLTCGDAVAFAVNERPVRGKRGDYRVKMRHGISTLLHGSRYALGVIFHDAT
jgi:uncharacterized protein